MERDEDDRRDPDLEGALDSIRADARAGALRPLAEYASLAPRHGHAIADAYLAAARSEPCPAELAPMRILGHYALIRELGRGGQGVVWLAEDTRLGRKVALKVLSGLGPSSADSVRRFRREAEVASRLNDPGICAVLDAGVSEGLPFIAMQFVEGETLADRIERARSIASGGEASFAIQFSQVTTLGADGDAERERVGEETTETSGVTREEIRDTLEVFERAARALHAAHEAGVVHRDVKPGNIMVRRDGRPVILDFGLARSEDGSLPTLTQSGDLFGTPAYMSPEQVNESPMRLDRRTDVYSLGATLFECLTLRRPFEAPTREGLYRAIVGRDAPNARSVNPAVPADLAVIVETALEKDRDRRYQTALELAEELGRVRRHEPIVARPAGAWTRAVRFAQRNPGVTVLLAAVFIAMATAAFIFWWRGEQVADRNSALTEALGERDSANSELNAANISLEERRRELQAALGRVTEEKGRVQTEKDRVTRLKDGRTLRRLLERAEGLFPSVPERIPDLEDWLREADALLENLPAHRAALAALETSAGPYRDEQRAVDHPEAWAAFVKARDRIAELERKLASVPAGEEADDLVEALAKAGRARERAERRMVERRSWGFDDESAWLHELLVDLVARLESCGSPEGAVADVRARLETARDLGPRTLGDHAEAWTAARERIRASERYGHLDVRPQIGLIPLGPDPEFGLEEFLHWETHARGAPLPQRGENGRWALTEETGLILVLIPAGTFTMGALRPKNPTDRGPNLDPFVTEREVPAHEVELSAYLISKYEMNQGQWERVTGERPSAYGPGVTFGDKTNTLLHPVEMVTWALCRRVLRRLGLELPTEAQWERAARAGGSTIWSHGDDEKGLDRYANLADAFGGANGFPPGTEYEVELNDGRTIHAPVGSYLPNSFGLHDVVGNVNEWCRDLFAFYGGPLTPGDGDRSAGSTANVHSFRGGNFGQLAVAARSAFREAGPEELRAPNLGVRPARALTF
ncbi:MAG: SUMF1/EgtB/PvdO family nonheme iron enzyme [Planctomycetota bacterium]